MLAPIDRATLAYVGVASVFTVVRGPRTWSALVVLLGLAFLALVAGVLAPRARRSGTASGQFLGDVYALAGALTLYSHVGFVHSARGVSHDGLVQQWEQALFGMQPSFEWIRACPWPALSTVMHSAYVSYYAILAAAPLGLWLTGRREAGRRTAALMAVTFFICFTIFLAFPVAGPRYMFPAPVNAATSVPVAALTHWLLRTGSSFGTAFPSSHVAVALVAAVAAWRGWRPLGAILIPLAVLLSLATVYGQFHYAVDALAGAGVAAVVLAASHRR